MNGIQEVRGSSPLGSTIYQLKMQKEISVAPMVGKTDRHFRSLARILSPSILLYTEMIHVNSIIYGNPDTILGFNEEELPVALQIATPSRKNLAPAVEKIKNFKYSEININCGCPSKAAQKGEYGIVLLNKPKTVAEIVSTLKENFPYTTISVKTRIGLGEKASLAKVVNFIETAARAGAEKFILHSRTAILGLNTKKNRKIPPLQYHMVYKIKEIFPNLKIVLNGGVKSVEEIRNHLLHVDGVMIGRAIYQNPWFLTELETLYNPNFVPPTPHQFLNRAISYIERESGNVHHSKIVKHMYNFFKNRRGSKKWRKTLNSVTKTDFDSHLLQDTLDYILS